jgi:hypothetical protein
MGAAAVGGAPASAAGASAESSPPNMLSTSEQAARLKPAVSAKARTRPFLSPFDAAIPLIMLSAARAPLPDKEIWRQKPNTIRDLERADLGRQS